MLKEILDNHWKKRLKLCILTLLICHLTIFFLSARPIQDDYALLAEISDNGMFQYLKDVWTTHGGNLTPMLLNSAAIASALNSFNFLTLSLFSTLTFISVALVVWVALFQIRVNGKSLPTGMSLIACLGTLFGFEGIFSPGLIGAYQFSSASAVHLWPIIFTLLGLHLATKFSLNILPMFILGFLAGNSNIAESFAVLVATFLLLVFPKKFEFEYSKIKLRVFVSGVIAGAVTIIIAPGFWIRATENTTEGIPSNYKEFIARFLKSVIVFSADILTHPILYIFLISGFLFQRKFKMLTVPVSKWSYLEVLFLTLFGSLVLGATFAYPAWHQSLGLLLLLPISSFLLGVRLERKFLISALNILPKIRLSLALMLILLVLRADYLTWNSGHQWARTNELNICVNQQNGDTELRNPEIRYPLFGLGVEDVQTWPWIHAAYIRWISNVPIPHEIDCKLVS